MRVKLRKTPNKEGKKVWIEINNRAGNLQAVSLSLRGEVVQSWSGLHRAPVQWEYGSPGRSARLLSPAVICSVANPAPFLPRPRPTEGQGERSLYLFTTFLSYFIQHRGRAPNLSKHSWLKCEPTPHCLLWADFKQNRGCSLRRRRLNCVNGNAALRPSVSRKQRVNDFSTWINRIYIVSNNLVLYQMF